MVKYLDEVYEVHSYTDLKNHIKENVWSPDYTRTLPAQLLHLAFGDFHTNPNFLKAFVDEISSANEYIDKLNLVINLTKISSNPAETFWRSLESIDEDELYALALVALFKVADQELAPKKLLDVLIKHNALPVYLANIPNLQKIEVEGVKDQFFIFNTYDSGW